MSIEKFGLVAEYVFDDSRGRANMKRTHGALNAFRGDISSTRKTVTRFGGAMLAGAAVALPIGAALIGGAKKAAEFEGQMSAVQAILGTTEENMRTLEMRAKQLGSTTKFTAKEAAEGMELLAMAGMDPAQVGEAIGGTLSLAAAGGLELAQASEITADIINSMGLEAEDAGHVADVLAKGASQASTSVAGLGTGFAYVAGKAKTMGISVEETTYLLGAMNDASLKGSSGGTALKNMLSKLAKPTKAGAEAFKKMGLEMVEFGEDGAKRMRPVQSIVEEINEELNKIDDPLKRAKKQEEWFGQIGSKGFSAVVARSDKQSKMSDEELAERSVDSFMAGSEAVEGAAERMAKARLKGVAGAMTQLGSASEGLVLELFDKSLMAPIEEVITDITEGISGIVQVMQALSNGEDLDGLEEQFGPVIVGIGMGLREAVEGVAAAFSTAKEYVTQFAQYLNENLGAEGVATLVKFGGALIVAGGLIGGIVVAIGAVMTVVSVLSSVAAAAGAMMMAAIWPVTGVLLLVYGAYTQIRNENETLGETVTRVWGMVKTWATDVYENAIEPFIEGLMVAYDTVMPGIQAAFEQTFGVAKELVLELWDIFNSFFGDSETDWKGLGETVGLVVGFIVENGINIIRSGVDGILNVVREVRGAFKMLAGGDIIGGLAKIGRALFDMVLEPVKTILKSVIDIADTVGVEIPESIRAFAFDSISVALEKERMDNYDDLDTGSMRGGLGGYAPIVAEVAKTQEERDYENHIEMMKAVRDGTLEAEEAKDPCQVTATTNLNLDGKKLAKQQSELQNELSERAGFRATPYQRSRQVGDGSLGGIR